MAEYSSKLPSFTSSENRDSYNSSNAETVEGDEEFYEGIEAPKFVDFTVPDHYCPDDRYWFCLRVGCDRKHEEEMDSEAIYKNFVLRVMAARSPNVKLRKALDRNASTKCPRSAPPKPSKPRLSRMAIISSFSKKMVDDKERAVRPLLKPKATPVARTKPVAAKYLTTPRNKKCIQNESSFRSVQNPKPTNDEVSKSRIVAKTLVFHSPKKTVKVKTSIERRTPVSKLCEGMNKLEISSQKKLAASKSSKSFRNSASRQLSSCKVRRKPEEPLCSKTGTNQAAKSGGTVKRKINHTDGSKKNHEVKQLLVDNVAEEFEPKKITHEEEHHTSSTISSSTHNSDLSLLDDSNRTGTCSDLEGSYISTSQATNQQENNSTDGNENGSVRLVVESCGERVDHLNLANHSSFREREEKGFADADNKENAAASDENRMHNKNPNQKGRKIIALHDQCGQVLKKDKNLKEGLISPTPVMKLRKPKPTNPKPFRLRTDERGILKEANLERRTDHVAPQTESATSCTLGVKLQMKQGNDIQKGSAAIVGQKISKGPERSKAAASTTPDSKKHHDRKVITSPLESTAMQRLERFKKIKSPLLQKHSIRQPQGLVEPSSFLIPGQKLDVIHENSPEVLELKRAGKTNVLPADDAGSRSSSRGRRQNTVAAEPNFHSTHLTRTCTKKLK